MTGFCSSLQKNFDSLIIFLLKSNVEQGFEIVCCVLLVSIDSSFFGEKVNQQSHVIVLQSLECRTLWVIHTFIEFELPEDAQAAIDNMNDGEMSGRTLRVNMAKPMKMKEGSSRPVWASDEWLQKYAGASLAEGGVGADRPKQGLDPQGE